ncbi:MAG: DUF192 domain-containing protein [Chloroflexi bacterium]|nr:DUF192 domain-containing protein [Chloroflexota bacterium]
MFRESSKSANAGNFRFPTPVASTPDAAASSGAKRKGGALLWALTGLAWTAVALLALSYFGIIGLPGLHAFDRTPAPSLERIPLGDGIDPATAKFAFLGGMPFRLSVADSIEEWQMGLAVRGVPDRDEALLFVYPGEGHWPVWVSDNHPPVDIVFLDSAKQVVDIQSFVPPMGEDDGTPTKVSPPRPVQFVLEMRAGTAGRYNFYPGMNATLR